MRFLVLLLLFSLNAHGELRKLTQKDFGANSVSLTPDLTADADASNAWNRYGVFLSSYPSGSPVVRPWSPPCVVCILPSIYGLITNQTTENQAGSVLVVDSRFPMKKLGLSLVGAKPALQISIRAESPTGDLIGTLTEAVDEKGAFLGFEGLDSQPISKVTIDYHSAETPEQLLGVTIESASPPRFETVLPQIAHARLGADLSLRTTISIVNLSNTTARGEIRFFTPAGNGLAVPFEGLAVPGDIAPFVLGSSRQFVTTGNSGLAGYARVVSDAPVQTIAHFQMIENNRVVAETAVPSVEGRFTVVGSYNRDVPTSGTVGPPPEPAVVNTALAIVNTSDKPASVSFHLREEQGWSREEFLSLAPGEQLARFISEIFDGLQDTRGTLKVFSSQPVAAILIKTVNGLPISILPLGSMED